MSEPDKLTRTAIPEHLMLSRLAQSEQMREFFIQMWMQNPSLARQGGAKVQNLLSPLVAINATISPKAPSDSAPARKPAIKHRMQKGFSLVTAIFLLVVLGGLGAVMMTFFSAQQQSSAQDVLGSRAYQAARAGIEWSAFQILRNGKDCAVVTQTLAAGTFNGTLSSFVVAVTCTATTHPESGAPGGTRTVFRITSTASRGTAGQPDFVERRIDATIAR